jgi:hypothetical protein
MNKKKRKYDDFQGKRDSDIESHDADSEESTLSFSNIAKKLSE